MIQTESLPRSDLAIAGFLISVVLLWMTGS